MLFVDNISLLVVPLMVCADTKSFSGGLRMSDYKYLFRYSDSFCALLIRRIIRVMRSKGETSTELVAAVEGWCSGSAG